MFLKSLGLFTITLVAAASAPALSLYEGDEGHLIIAGGALEKPEVSAVFARIKELAGTTGTIGIMPTASGVPEESAKGIQEDFDKLLGAGRTTVIPLTTSTAALANSTTVAALIRKQNILWFVGGNQERIVEVFRPKGKWTPAYAAVKDVLDAGGVVAGSSAGAAMMSDPMIRWGNSHDALTMGISAQEDRGVAIMRGMGLFSGGLTDQHFLRRGRLGRLVVALFLTKQRLGWGVDEKRAFEVERSTGKVRCLGPQALLVADRDRATSSPHKIRGVKLGLYGGGDTVDATGKATPPPNAKPLKADASASTETLGKAWDDFVIPRAMRNVARTGQPVVLSERGITLTLSPDKDLRAWSQGVAPEDISVAGVVLDIDVDPAAVVVPPTRRNGAQR